MTKKNTPFVDPTVPDVSIEVDGQEYKLCFSFNALATAESLTGLNLLVAMDFQKLSAITLRGLLFASLLHFQPDITLEEAGSLIKQNNAPEVMKALVKAYVDSNPEPDPENDSKNVEKPSND